MNTEYLNKLARLAVLKGVGLQEGQPLIIRSAIEPEMARLARVCAAEAWKAGAKDVTILWSDPEIDKLRYENAEEKALETAPAWKGVLLEDAAADDAAFLTIDGEDPDLFADVNPAKMLISRKALNKITPHYRKGLDAGKLAWSIVAAPSTGWAKKVYPDLSEEEAIERLWQDIFAISRIDENDPLENWQKHGQSFENRVNRLNSLNLEKLHYQSANGTDLWVELPEYSIFVGGSSVLQSGQAIFCNIPTEEIFTAPRLDGVNGTLEAVMPLSHNGKIIDGFGFIFKDGEAVEWHAREGKDVLDAIFASADGANRLGEVALVDKTSPIRKQNKIFYNTLFDENAACHFAFGQSYAETIENGNYLSEDDLKEKGMNQSDIHVDFMVGADDLTITGFTRDGKELAIFENGSFSPEFDL